MDFLTRVVSKYVYNELSEKEAKSIILGTFAISTADFRTDEEKIRLIKDIFKKLYVR